MLEQRLIDELKARQAEIFALCSRLVRIPSDLVDVASVHAGVVLDTLAPGGKR
jgi:hypothetical protein